MAATHPTGFTRTQIALHWAVVVLVACQYIFSDGIERAWRAFVNGTYTDTDLTGAAMAHAAGGALVLLLAIWRLVLRFRVGAPAPDPAEPAALQVLSKVTHSAIYLLIILVPLSGMAAWGGGIKDAIGAHLLGKTLLMVLIVLHVVGALTHQFFFKTDVLRRMFVPVK